VFGVRMGYLVAATGFFAFMLILAALWTFGAPGTPRFLGPKGSLPSWVAVAQGDALRSPTFPVIDRYPEEPWETPKQAGLTGEEEPASLALKELLAEEANRELQAMGGEGEITPENFEIADLRFTTQDGTELVAGTGFSTTGGRQVMVVGYQDEGNEPVPSYIALGIAVIGFVVHLPFLDRAERRRKDVLTGGDQPPFLGPA
jgi:hypothetical protein